MRINWRNIPITLIDDLSIMRLLTKNLFRFTATGLVAGAALGWLLSLPSGNRFVTLGIATLGLFVGVILGIVHQNDA